MDVERLESLFRENFTHFGELGASLSIWKDGREAVSLWGGWRDRNQTEEWTEETPVLVWSATKGPSAACLLHAIQERGIELPERAARLWPEFAQCGKEDVTLAQILSHQSGVAALDRTVSVFEHSTVAEAIAEQAPQWKPGTSHGYGPRLYGFMIDELVRRMTGQTIGAYWRDVFSQPLGLDCWIGLPLEMVDSIASVHPAKTAAPKDRFYSALDTSGSLTHRAFNSPAGLSSVASMNAPGGRTASLPGFGGIGTARALGKFYAMLACGGMLSGHRWFQPSSLDWMKTTLVQGDDRVLLSDTAFSAGFMRDPVSPDGRKHRAIFGPALSSFGHPGAGGSHAFADPENRIAFAYVMNQMEPGVLPGLKVTRLVEAIYG